MSTRVAAGVPTGGQFVAAARREATTGTLSTVHDKALSAAIDFATDYCEAAGGARPGMCHTAAWNVEAEFGWPITSGRRDGLPHHWNTMPDGRIFDATAAMFGDDGPTVTTADDPRYTT